MDKTIKERLQELEKDLNKFFKPKKEESKEEYLDRMEKELNNFQDDYKKLDKINHALK